MERFFVAGSAYLLIVMGLSPGAGRPFLLMRVRLGLLDVQFSRLLGARFGALEMYCCGLLGAPFGLLLAHFCNLTRARCGLRISGSDTTQGAGV